MDFMHVPCDMRLLDSGHQIDMVIKSGNNHSRRMHNENDDDDGDQNK